MNATTTWCTNGSLNSRPNVASEISTVPPPGAAKFKFIPTVPPTSEIGSTLHRGTDVHVAAGGPGHCAADQQQISFGIDSDDHEVLLGHTPIAHVAGHLLALEDATGRLVLADRT